MKNKLFRKKGNKTMLEPHLWWWVNYWFFWIPCKLCWGYWCLCIYDWSSI